MLFLSQKGFRLLSPSIGDSCTGVTTCREALCPPSQCSSGGWGSLTGLCSHAGPGAVCRPRHLPAVCPGRTSQCCSLGPGLGSAGEGISSVLSPGARSLPHREQKRQERSLQIPAIRSAHLPASVFPPCPAGDLSLLLSEAWLSAGAGVLSLLPTQLPPCSSVQILSLRCRVTRGFLWNRLQWTFMLHHSARAEPRPQSSPACVWRHGSWWLEPLLAQQHTLTSPSWGPSCGHCGLWKLQCQAEC